MQATPRPEEGKEGEIDYPINQLLGTDYKINHQGKGQVLYYITQPTRFIYHLGHQSLLPSITGSCTSPFPTSGMASAYAQPGTALPAAAQGFEKTSSSQDRAGPGINPIGPK